MHVSNTLRIDELGGLHCSLLTAYAGSCETEATHSLATFHNFSCSFLLTPSPQTNSLFLILRSGLSYLLAVFLLASIPASGRVAYSFLSTTPS